MSTRTLEQIAADLADKCYDLAREDNPCGYKDAETRIALIILAALREAMADKEQELAEAKARDEFNWNIIKGCMDELEMVDMGPSMIRGEIQEWKCSHERLKAKEVAATDRAVLLALERDQLRARVAELEKEKSDLGKLSLDALNESAELRVQVAELEQDRARLIEVLREDIISANIIAAEVVQAGINRHGITRDIGFIIHRCKTAIDAAQKGTQ